MGITLWRVWAAGRPRGRRRWRARRRLLAGLLLAITLPVLALSALAWDVQASTAHAIFSGSDPRLPHNHAALIFGAGLTASGAPSPVLADRVATGVDLYRAHKVDKLLMSGDNSQPDYNEVAAMRRAAIGLGVPERDIVLDYAGFRTYDSCYRAHSVFGLAAATLVTNAYHPPRALYTCAHLGLDVVGVPADREAPTPLFNRLRELPALAVTRWGLFVDARPHFLGPPVNVDAPAQP